MFVNLEKKSKMATFFYKYSYFKNLILRYQFNYVLLHTTQCMSVEDTRWVYLLKYNNSCTRNHLIWISSSYSFVFNPFQVIIKNLFKLFRKIFFLRFRLFFNKNNVHSIEITYYIDSQFYLFKVQLKSTIGTDNLFLPV